MQRGKLHTFRLSQWATKIAYGHQKFSKWPKSPMEVAYGHVSRSEQPSSLAGWCYYWFRPPCLGRGPKQPKHGAAEQWRHHPSMYHWWHLKIETALINRVSFWQVRALLHQLWGPTIKKNPKHMNWANAWQNKGIVSVIYTKTKTMK